MSFELLCREPLRLCCGQDGVGETSASPQPVRGPETLGQSTLDTSPGAACVRDTQTCGQPQRQQAGGQAALWSDLCQRGGLFSVSREFCLENQKQLNKSLRATVGTGSASVGFVLLFEPPRFRGSEGRQEPAVTWCEDKGLWQTGRRPRDSSSGLKRKLLRHVLVPVSQSSELGGANTVRGGWPRAGGSPWTGALRPAPLPGLGLTASRSLRRGKVCSLSLSICPNQWPLLAVLDANSAFAALDRGCQSYLLYGSHFSQTHQNSLRSSLQSPCDGRGLTQCCRSCVKPLGSWPWSTAQRTTEQSWLNTELASHFSFLFWPRGKRAMPYVLQLVTLFFLFFFSDSECFVLFCLSQ